MNSLKFSTSGLIHATLGSKGNHSFDSAIKIKDNKTKSNVCGDLVLVKVEKGINALITKSEIDLEFTCGKCLGPFTNKIKIEKAERTFLIHPPELVEDPDDLFLVDNKAKKIDITEMLRQEIILHFPPLLVCSKGCKGLCGNCGHNLNKSKCNCDLSSKNKEHHYPLSDLKKLLTKDNAKTSSTKKENH